MEGTVCSGNAAAPGAGMTREVGRVRAVDTKSYSCAGLHLFSQFIVFNMTGLYAGKLRKTSS